MGRLKKTFIEGIAVGMSADRVLELRGRPWDDTGKPTEVLETDKGGRPQAVKWIYSDIELTFRYKDRMWRVSEVEKVGADD